MDSTTAASPAPARRPGLLINRSYGLMWAGQTVSFLGDFAFNTTLVLWIGLRLAAGQSWAPLAVSGVLVAASAAVLLVGPLAGVFVDRWDKRRTMLAVSVIQALVVVALLPASGLVPIPFLAQFTGIDPAALPLEWRLGVVYAAVFLVNAGAQFVNPASLALTGDVVPEALQARASGLLQVSSSLAIIVGPPLGSILFPLYGPEWAIGIDALSFVAAFLVMLAIRAPRGAHSVAAGARGHVLRELGSGIRFVFTNRVLATLVVGISIAMLGFGAINALDVFFVTRNLHADPSLYGLTGTAIAIGALVGAILAGAVAERLGLIRVFWLALAGMGVAMLVWSRMTEFYPALGVLAVAGVIQSALNVAATPLLLRVTPKELVGRAIAIIQPTMTLTSLASIALAGYLASTALVGFRFEAPGVGWTFGPIDTIFGAAGLLAIIGGLYCALNLRGVRLPAQAPAPAEGATPAAGVRPAAEATPEPIGAPR